MAFDANDPADVALLDAAIEKAVAGLKAKNSELIAAEKGVKSKLKELEEKFSGLDADEIRNMLSKIENDEDAKLIAQGKANEVVERRVERLRKDLENRVKAAEDKSAADRAFADRFRERVLSAAIKDAAIKSGCVPEAADDFVFRGSRIFKVDEEGNVTCLDKDGKAIFGKDGKTPLAPEEWVESLRETAPHLWPKAAGSGATGSGGKVTKSYDEMSESERTHLFKTNRAEFDRVKAASKTTKK